MLFQLFQLHHNSMLRERNVAQPSDKNDSACAPFSKSGQKKTLSELLRLKLRLQLNINFVAPEMGYFEKIKRLQMYQNAAQSLSHIWDIVRVLLMYFVKRNVCIWMVIESVDICNDATFVEGDKYPVVPEIRRVGEEKRNDGNIYTSSNDSENLSNRRPVETAGSSIRRGVSLNRLPPVLRQADTHEGECLEVAVALGRTVSGSGRARYAAISLRLSPRLPFLCSLINHETRRPTVIPDAHDLEHISTLQSKLIRSPGLVSPQDGNLFARVNVVLGIVVFEERQLLRLLTSQPAGR